MQQNNTQISMLLSYVSLQIEIKMFFSQIYWIETFSATGKTLNIPLHFTIYLKSKTFLLMYNYVLQMVYNYLSEKTQWTSLQ